MTTTKKRGRPAKLRPVDAPIDELDPDAVELLDGDGELAADLRRLELETSSGVYARRRAEF